MKGHWEEISNAVRWLPWTWTSSFEHFWFWSFKVMSKRLCGWPHGQNIRKPCGFQRSQSLSLISSWDDHQLTFIFFSLKPPGPSGHENVPATVGQWLKFAFRSQASGAVGNGTRIIISFPIKTLRSQLYSTLGYTAGRCWLNYHELSISGQTQTVSSRVWAARIQVQWILSTRLTLWQWVFSRKGIAKPADTTDL